LASFAVTKTSPAVALLTVIWQSPLGAPPVPETQCAVVAVSRIVPAGWVTVRIAAPPVSKLIVSPLRGWPPTVLCTV